MDVTARQAEMCAAMAEEHRLRLLYAMAEIPRSVSQLVEGSGMSQPNVSRHLRILREGGLVQTQRQGRSVIYSPTDPRILTALALLGAVISDHVHVTDQTAEGHQEGYPQSAW